jgi:hypothetical protein
MSGTTANLGLRYPTAGDNVSPLEAHFENLADDVDAALGDFPVLKRLFTERRDWIVNSITNAAEVQVNSGDVDVVAGKTYELRADFLLASTVAGDVGTIFLRLGDGAGDSFKTAPIPLPLANTYYEASIRGLWVATWTGTETFSVSIKRTSGTGTLNTYGAAWEPGLFTVDLVS